MVAAIAGGTLQLGDATLPPIASLRSQLLIGIIGTVLVISSSILIRREAGSLDGQLLGDPRFWLKVFNAMPAAFIKEYPNDTHVINNEACRALQGEPPRHAIHRTDTAYMVINADHRTGDFIAATSGASAQLELSEHVPTGYPQLILTTKTRVQYGERVFIVGWSVPIEAADGMLPTGLSPAFRFTVVP
jgi:hypothetical protein